MRHICHSEFSYHFIRNRHARIRSFSNVEPWNRRDSDTAFLSEEPTGFWMGLGENNLPTLEYCASLPLYARCSSFCMGRRVRRIYLLSCNEADSNAHNRGSYGLYCCVRRRNWMERFLCSRVGKCFTIILTGMSFAFTWFRLKSGSLWTGMFLRASHNKFMQGVFPKFTTDKGALLYFVGEFGVATAVVALLVAYIFWKKRHQLEPYNRS